MKKSNRLLESTLDSCMTKDNIANKLYSLGEKTSGTKQELLSRLLDATSDLSTQEIIGFIDKETLKILCVDYGVPTSGTKSDLIDRLVIEIFPDSLTEGDSKRDEKSSPSIKNHNFSSNNYNEKLFEILTKNMSKDDLERGLNKCDLKTNGTKSEMALRLLEGTANDPRETLLLMTGQSLNDYADKLKIPRRRSKEDQVDDILNKVFEIKSKHIGIKEPIETKVSFERQQPLPEIRNQQIKSTNKDPFELIAQEIIEWVPIRGYKSEEGYQTDLYGYLKGKGHQVDSEIGTSRIDILVDGKIPIELKKSPSLGELDRAQGQLDRHWHAYGSVILVICRPTFMQDLEDFERRFDSIAKLRNMKYKIIKKG